MSSTAFQSNPLHTVQLGWGQSCTCSKCLAAKLLSEIEADCADGHDSINCASHACDITGDTQASAGTVGAVTPSDDNGIKLSLVHKDLEFIVHAKLDRPLRDAMIEMAADVEIDHRDYEIRTAQVRV